MKKIALLFAALALFTVAAVSQTTSTPSSSQTETSDKSAASAPLRSLVGKISDDGKSFTDDKTNTQWTIQNPDDVKGHEGHHVKLSAHVYKDKNEVHVMKVTMMGTKAAKEGKKGKAPTNPS